MHPADLNDSRYDEALIHMNSAQKLFSVKHYADALTEIDRSINIAPGISLFYSVKGSILYLLGRTSEAKCSWEKALELDPSLENVRALLQRMY